MVATPEALQDKGNYLLAICRASILITTFQGLDRLRSGDLVLVPDYHWLRHRQPPLVSVKIGQLRGGYRIVDEKRGRIR